MAAFFGIQLDGDLKAALRLEEFPEIARARLAVAFESIEQRMLAAVLALEPEKTGELRSLTGGRVYSDPNKMAARVAVRTQNANQAKKAGALEYGSRGKSITVQQHPEVLRHFWRKAVADIEVEERTYKRTPKINALRFLRAGVESVRDSGIAELRAAIDQAVEDSNA